MMNGIPSWSRIRRPLGPTFLSPMFVAGWVFPGPGRSGPPRDEQAVQEPAADSQQRDRRLRERDSLVWEVLRLESQVGSEAAIAVARRLPPIQRELSHSDQSRMVQLGQQPAFRHQPLAPG
jgi:hypothetical protein